MLNTAVVTVGRLLEVRICAGYKSATDVDTLFNAIGAATQRIPMAQRVVVAADWRRCPIMSGEAAQQAVARLTRTNPRTERSAALVLKDSPAAMLQFTRLVREAHHPDRKLLYTTRDMMDWLSPLLSAAETARLKDFLGADISALPS